MEAAVHIVARDQNRQDAGTLLMKNELGLLGLTPAMQENLDKLGYGTMTAVQRLSIPPILAGQDVLAQAKTGSGKTAAFGIGVLENLDATRYRVQVLVLCPTRELAMQVTSELRRIARFKHNLKLLSLTGGLPLKNQELSLRHQAHVVIGTPGRVLKLLQRGSLQLDELGALVLDEADRMLDMGFAEQLENILQFVPSTRQTLCFSATFPPAVRRLTRTLLNTPVEIAVETQHEPAAIEQHFFAVAAAAKSETMIALLDRHRPPSTIVFCNTKDQCRAVTLQLSQAGYRALALHGDLEQKERTEILIQFANGSGPVLVATDVAARGIDIVDLGAVMNFDLPFVAETYVHRVGRTGRAGRSGLSLSLVLPNEEFRVQEIGTAMGQRFRTQTAAFPTAPPTAPPPPAMVTLSINGGRRQKIGAGDILGALTAGPGIDADDIGKIDRLDSLTFVAVKRQVASAALAVLQDAPIKGRRFLARRND